MYASVNECQGFAPRIEPGLPADLRHRWGIDEGGEIGFIDLGNAALIIPGGVQAAQG